MTRRSPWSALLDADILREDEDETMFFDELAAVGRRRRAARELADEAYYGGEYVEMDEIASVVERLAASDGATTLAVYWLGALRVEGQLVDGRLVLRQNEGGAGATVLLGDDWIPLERGVQVTGPVLATLPESLLVVDRRGRRHILPRVDSIG